ADANAVGSAGGGGGTAHGVGSTVQQTEKFVGRSVEVGEVECIEGGETRFNGESFGDVNRPGKGHVQCPQPAKSNIAGRRSSYARWLRIERITVGITGAGSSRPERNQLRGREQICSDQGRTRGSEASGYIAQVIADDLIEVAGANVAPEGAHLRPG